MESGDARNRKRRESRGGDRGHLPSLIGVMGVKGEVTADNPGVVGVSGVMGELTEENLHVDRDEIGDEGEERRRCPCSQVDFEKHISLLYLVTYNLFETIEITHLSL